MKGNAKAGKIKALALLARGLVDKALEGDVAALKEIGDRLDGKPVQGVDLGGEVALVRIERVIVDPERIEPKVVTLEHSCLQMGASRDNAAQSLRPSTAPISRPSEGSVRPSACRRWCAGSRAERSSGPANKRRRHLALIVSIALGGIGKLASHGLNLPDRSPCPASQLLIKR